MRDLPGRAADVRRYADLAAWLGARGFSAPEVYASDPGAGLMLMEDFGDRKFTSVIAGDPSLRQDLLSAAVSMLGELAEIPPPATPVLVRQDAGHLTAQAMMLTAWYCPQPGDREAELRAILLAAFADFPPARPCLVLRDFHADNLFWLPARAGRKRVGLIDFQDGLCGHPAYDLVSLLQDARAPLTEDAEAELLSAYGGRPPGEDFRRAYAVLGAQRHLRLLGNLTRLSRMVRPAYADLLPQTWAFLQRNLRHPALSPLRRWVETCLPAPSPGAA
jgi:aminoglycoside/choline kinase family phosphotransferase